MQDSKSEVARLLEQIKAEYDSAWSGLYGIAQGTPRHSFIEARMNTIGELAVAIEKYLPASQAWARITDVLNTEEQTSL